MLYDSLKEIMEKAGHKFLYKNNLKINDKTYQVTINKTPTEAVILTVMGDKNGYELNFLNGIMRFGWIIDNTAKTPFSISSGCKRIKPEDIRQFIEEYKEHIRTLAKALPHEVAREISSLFTAQTNELEKRLREEEAKVYLSGDGFLGE